MQRLYFDHNATSPLRNEARDALLEALAGRGPANPSSAHAEGRAARRRLEDARDELAAVVGCRAEQVVFTSGGSESNALAFAAAPADRPILVSAIEHPSVLRQPRVEVLPVDAQGALAPGPEFVASDPRASRLGAAGLVSMAAANHEVGTVPDLAALVAAAAAAGDVLVHTDASQALGRIPFHFTTLGVDLATLSGHKIGAPVGIGALLVGDRAALRPLVRGGEQEHGRRAGTEAVALAVSFAAAARAARDELSSHASRYRGWVRDLYSYIRDVDDSVILNSPAMGGLPNTLNVSFPGRPGPALVHRLDLEGVAVSHGSACASGSLQPSAVLLAMTGDEERARCSVRISFGPRNSDAEVAELMRRLAVVLDAVRPRALR